MQITDYREDCLLPPCRERCRRHCSATEKSDKVAPPHVGPGQDNRSSELKLTQKQLRWSRHGIAEKTPGSSALPPRTDIGWRSRRGQYHARPRGYGRGRSRGRGGLGSCDRQARLHELGWIEGHTIAIEYRWAEGRSARLAEIAAEFVRLGVDVIFATGTAPALAAKQATSMIPIVFPTGYCASAGVRSRSRSSSA